MFNRLDSRLNVCLHDAAGCSTAVVKPHKRLFNRLDNRLYRVNGVIRCSPYYFTDPIDGCDLLGRYNSCLKTLDVFGTAVGYTAVNFEHQ